MFSEVEPAPFWELELQMGHRRYDTRFSAYCLPLRERATAPRPDPGVEIGPEASRVTLGAALKMTQFPASAEGRGSLLRAYVAEFLRAVIRAIDIRPELPGRAGPGVLGPLDVLPGMMPAAATRASYAARVKWRQSMSPLPRGLSVPFGWSHLSRLRRGLSPAPPSLRVYDGKAQKGLEAVVD